MLAHLKINTSVAGAPHEWRKMITFSTRSEVAPCESWKMSNFWSCVCLFVCHILWVCVSVKVEFEYSNPSWVPKARITTLRKPPNVPAQTALRPHEPMWNAQTHLAPPRGGGTGSSIQKHWIISFSVVSTYQPIYYRYKDEYKVHTYQISSIFFVFQIWFYGSPFLTRIIWSKHLENLLGNVP